MIKFIVDAQLPKKLSDYLVKKGFDSIHTLQLIDRNKTKDKSITLISEEQNRVVITKDDDFLQSYLLNGKSSRLILVKTGNISNKELLSLFEDQLTFIAEILIENALIELHANQIIIHSTK